MKYLVLVITILAAAVIAHGEQTLTFKTLDGRQFTKVTVTGKDDAGIRVMTDSGVEQVTYQQLPTEIQKAVGYDAQKALAAKSAASKASEEEARFDSSIRGNGPPPVAIPDAKSDSKQSSADPELEALEKKKSELLAQLIPAEKAMLAKHPKAAIITGKVLQKIPEGLLVVASGEKPEGSLVPSAHGTVLIVGYPFHDVVDDDPIRWYGEESGQFAYRTALGTRKTVRRYQAINE